MASATEAPRNLTAQDARSLIVAVRKFEGMTPKLLARYAIEQDFSQNERFYYLTGVLGIPRAEGVDNYAVDKRTGDVWWATACSQETTPRFEKFKRRMRRRLGLSEAAYEKIRVDGPDCETWWKP